MGMTTRELQTYLLRRLNEERARIHPELRDLAGGDSEAAIDGSIADLIGRSASIAARAPAAPASPPEDFTENVREGTTASDVSAMDLAAYAAFRAEAGIGQADNAYGIFGR